MRAQTTSPKEGVQADAAEQFEYISAQAGRSHHKRPVTSDPADILQPGEQRYFS